MKRIYKGLFTLLILSAFVSCGDFMDVHKEWIKDGEIIYSPKIDSMIFIAGQNRIQFRCWLYKSPNVRSVDLYWNSGADSLIIPVNPSTEIDSFYTVIPNLEEKSFTFDARTTDIYGHKSLYMTNFGTVYGEQYRSTLSSRRINTVTIEEYDNQPCGMISLFSAAVGLIRTEFRFTKSDGTTGTISVPASSNLGVCAFAKPGSSFESRSLYIPETEAVDTFATAWTQYDVPYPDVSMYRYDRSSWEVLAVSDQTESDGGGMHTLLDGNLGNYWHSQWDGGNAPLPHWALIDMKTPKNIVFFDIYRRSGNTDTRTVECYLGDNPDGEAGPWTKISEGMFTSGDLLQVEPTDIVTKGRYLLIRLPDSNREPFTSIAEIYPYGGF